jgi:myo-inositol 2-dehydrogenase/D-chiro-inositol 1-dehydrogenase
MPTTNPSSSSASAPVIGIGLIGSQFIARAHAEAVRRFVTGAELRAVASPTAGHAEALAREFAIPQAFTDTRALLDRKNIDLVLIGVPNDLHAQVVIAAAQAGKHVAMEKPLCMTLAEADQMIAACAAAKRHLFYAEELVFAPKYVRIKQLIEEGALGRPYLVKQLEKHSGPHSPWFWDVDRSGGGVLFDMGCHGIEFARWIYDKPKVRAVTAHCATVAHAGRTRAEDDGLLVLEFEGGGRALIEDSWAFFGGIDDRAEVYGTEGSVFCDLVHGNAMKTWSNPGYGYAMEKAASTRGYSFTVFEEGWNYGFPQEIQHMVDCLRFGQEPRETGADGREVLRILFAAYESAAQGRTILMDGYQPAYPSRPIEAWLRRPGAAAAGK